MDYEEYIKRARELIRERESGGFTLPDLFGSEWDEIDRGVRKGLGREFKRLVDAGKIGDVAVQDDKKSNNLRQYKKI